jgi:hypothetical protein
VLTRAWKRRMTLKRMTLKKKRRRKRKMMMRFVSTFRRVIICSLTRFS